MRLIFPITSKLIVAIAVDMCQLQHEDVPEGDDQARLQWLLDYANTKLVEENQSRAYFAILGLRQALSFFDPISEGGTDGT